MQLPNITTVLSGLLVLGAAFGNTQNAFPARAIDNKGGPNAIPSGGKPATSPVLFAKPLGINCAALLRRAEVNCTGRSKKTCDLLSWLYAGCQKAPECAKDSGKAAKRCCDNADRLPFGGGVYYDGYLRACAPQYQVQRFDRPDFIDRPCSNVADCTNGLSKGLCDMRDFEVAGCQQRAKCDAKIKSVSELPQCCSEFDRKPQGLFSQLYQSRFDLKCLRK